MLKSNWNYPTVVWTGENRVNDLNLAEYILCTGLFDNYEKDLKYSDSSWQLSLDSLLPFEAKKSNEYSPIKIPEGRLDLSIKELTFNYENSPNIFSNFTFNIKIW